LDPAGSTFLNIIEGFRPLTHYRPAQRCRFEIEKNISENLFSSLLSQFKKKYHSSGNLKLKNLGIFQCLKFRILMEKILPKSLKLNFTPNTLGGYGLVG